MQSELTGQISARHIFQKKYIADLIPSFEYFKFHNAVNTIELTLGWNVVEILHSKKKYFPAYIILENALAIFIIDIHLVAPSISEKGNVCIPDVAFFGFV